MTLTAWFASKTWGKNVNKQEEINKAKKDLATKVTRLDVLLAAEGGKITQGMFDYGGDYPGLFRKKGKKLYRNI